MSTLEKTKHTPPSEPAMRAAGAVMLWLSVQRGFSGANQYSLAEIIDQETAAPDLLEACENLLASNAARDDGAFEVAKKEARAAIAKATG